MDEGFFDLELFLFQFLLLCLVDSGVMVACFT